MSAKAFIAGVAGLCLTPEERAFIAAERPWGFILFRRNIANLDQVRALTDELRAVSRQPDAPILIDQEGGRVQRLGPPLARAFPPAAHFGQLARRDPDAGREAAWLGARLIAHDLHRLGIDVNCLPVLDLPIPGAHDVIGDRALGADADCVARLGQAQAEGLLDGGVLPVMKHIPGHGRANADSHHALPVVNASADTLAATDFRPFSQLADLPIAMTAHVLYAAFDADRPATVSPLVVSEVIRRRIGFDGLLLSDDIAMEALSGSLAERAHAALGAGCDVVLHCNGRLDEMRAVAQAVPELSGIAAARAARALAQRRPPAPFDAGAGAARFDELLARLN